MIRKSLIILYEDFFMKFIIKYFKFVLLFFATLLSLTSCNYSTNINQTPTQNSNFTVTWVNYDGTILEIDENVEYGTLPSYDGETPKKASDDQYTYIFDSWTPTLKKVIDNATYKATYKTVINTYSVTWMNDDLILETDEVPYGTLPSYNGETPKKEADEQYTYEFSGWSPEIKPVAGDTTYYAIFDKKPNEYTITWKNYDGTILEIDENVKYGTIPTFNYKDELIKPDDSFYSYEFVGWSPKIYPVNGDQEYIAQYSIIECENFSFVLDETGTSYILDCYNGNETECVRIPNTYNNLPVSKINEYAFSNISINNLFIPITIKNISKNAFSSSKISNILLEESEITEEFIYSWDEFNPRIFTGICYIDDEGIIYKFEDNEVEIATYYGQIKKAYISEAINVNGKNISVTSIGNEAFRECTSLTSITIPSSVTTIGNAAFYNCSSLNLIFIPSSVTTIGDYAFYTFNSLYIYCEVSSEPIGWLDWIISTNTRVKWGVLFFKDFIYKINDSNITITNYIGTDKEITIPSSINIDGKDMPVTVIGDKAFEYHESLTTVDIPSSVTTIGDYAFYYCTSLTSINIPSSVTTIGNYAFEACASLTSINIPSSVTTIGYYAFGYCTSLTSINIPSSVTTIGDYAFYNCSSLIIYCDVSSQPDGWSDDRNSSYRPVYFNITVITTNEFIYGLNNSEITLICYIGTSEEITIPSFVEINGENLPVTTIGNSAFEYCTSLTSINIPSSVTTIGHSAFYYCTSLTSINIPSSVTTIGGSTFNYCTSLTSINIPSSVTTIGGYAFRNCTSLTSVYIPSSVTTIGHSAFEYCTSLTSINIPSSVTTIGYYAFYNCSSLIIYCDVSSQPDGWSDDRNYSNRPVIWGKIL